MQGHPHAEVLCGHCQLEVIRLCQFAKAIGIVKLLPGQLTDCSMGSVGHCQLAGAPGGV